MDLDDDELKATRRLNGADKYSEEIYIEHNKMIAEILKECEYMITNRFYMNDDAIKNHAEQIKSIAKYYIKNPEWTNNKED